MRGLEQGAEVGVFLFQVAGNGLPFRQPGDLLAQGVIVASGIPIMFDFGDGVADRYHRRAQYFQDGCSNLDRHDAELANGITVGLAQDQQGHGGRHQ